MTSSSTFSSWPPMSFRYAVIAAMFVIPVSVRAATTWDGSTDSDWFDSTNLVEGSAPTQLALAILTEHLGDVKRAVELHLLFRAKVVERLAHDEWDLTGAEVEEAVAEIQRGRQESLGSDDQRNRISG